MIIQEPYVKLRDAKDFEALSEEDLILINQNNRQSLKANFYQLAFDFIKENQIYGNYLEFGVHKARTFRMALTNARMQRLDKMRFFAFDSFEGLPLSTTHNNFKWQSGALATSKESFLDIIKNFGIYTDSVICVEGFYDDSLSEEYKNEYLNNENKAAFVTVDCDLYESAVPVFKFLEYIIQPGTIIYLDDYFVGHKGDSRQGVAKAFDEFKLYSRFKFTEFLDIGWWGKSYITRG